MQFIGPPCFDVMLAQASRRVIVSVDRIISTETPPRASHLTKLPCVMVDAVVEAPQGAHPSASPLYQADDKHLRGYLKASGATGSFAQNTRDYVNTLSSHDAYVDRVGGAKLAGISVSATNL